MYVLRRIPVQNLILIAAGLLFVGCSAESHSSIPVSVQQPPPFSYSGRIGRIWGGDNFEVVENGKLHYAFIRGIDTPEPGQPFHEEAKRMLRQLAKSKRTVIHVLKRDEWKREVCDVRITNFDITDEFTANTSGESDVDPALELLQSGLAWFDQTDGPYAESYRNAEATAKEQGLGLWSQPNPVAPWEFWQQQVMQITPDESDSEEAQHEPAQ
ncbi:thermonuclease family protein [Mariniblastus fucicola]|uniref:TNase-like domain-containing protein n=1 Tax=Mariniblastus fucicola TaxID=980251 RepID=A0A5B9PFE3_9BACT|nr:thermonuclease family protein [Mariniblastus fucicola]QEG24269.1 hypothetical protein MFFC18_41870 [Mariniblastus fucicola]